MHISYDVDTSAVLLLINKEPVEADSELDLEKVEE